MTYILSTIVTLFLILSFGGLIFMLTEDFDFDFGDLEWFQKIFVICGFIAIGLIVLGLVVGLVIFVRYCLLEIPFIKEFVIRMEWK